MVSLGAGLGPDGPLSPLARRQYGAVAAMRWQMLRHSLRTLRGNFEVAARIAVTSFFALVALAIGVGLGVGAYFVASGRPQSPGLLAALFWPVFLLWQLLPVLASSFQEHVDLSGFLRFPMSFASYMLLSLVFGLSDIASVMGLICLCGIWTGLVAAQPHAVAGVTAVVVLFAAFNLLLTRMIFAWIDRWLAQRRTREILGMCFLFLILAFQMINPVMQHYHGRRPPVNRTTLRAANRVQAVLPPGLAGRAVGLALAGGGVAWLVPVGALGLYAAGAGLLLGFRLGAEYRGENPGEGSVRTTRRKPMVAAATSAAARRSRGGWGVIGAIVGKELRTLSRSGVVLYSLVAPLVLLFVFGGASSRGVSYASRFALPLAVAYSFLGLTRMIYNSLGGEGAGIQLYFVSPTPFRTVMLAKNLVQLLLFGLELTLACGIVRFRFGLPAPEVIAATFCWMLFAVPLQLAAGNLMSIKMAYRMTLTRISREEGATGNGLLSMLVQVLIVGVGAGVFLPLSRYGYAGAAAGVFLALAVVSAAFWLRVFSHVDRMAAAAGEGLIQTLARAA